MSITVLDVIDTNMRDKCSRLGRDRVYARTHQKMN